MRRLVFILAVVCTFLVALPTTGSSDVGGTNRPYKATQTGTATSTGGGPFPGPFTAAVAFTDIGTHTGRGSGVSSSSTTFFVPLVPCVAPAGTGLLASGSNTGTITAANGDLLFFTISVTVCQVVGVGTASGTLTFVGGTGRFVDASGTAAVNSTFDSSVSPTLFESLVVGTISY